VDGSNVYQISCTKLCTIDYFTFLCLIVVIFKCKAFISSMVSKAGYLIIFFVWWYRAQKVSFNLEFIRFFE